MMCYAARAGSVRLIYMYSLYGTSQLSSWSAIVGRCTTDGVVEDENPVSTWVPVGTCIRLVPLPFAFNGISVHSRLLQDLHDLRVVNTLDMLIICELSLFALMFENLEASFVQAEVLLVSTKIMYSNLYWVRGTSEGFWSADVAWSWWRAVLVLFQVVDYALDIATLVAFLSCGNHCRSVILLRRRDGGGAEVRSWERVLRCCSCHFGAH